MRYNFKPTVSPMSPCFCGRMEHIIFIKEGLWVPCEFWAKGRENQSGNIVYPDIGEDGIFWSPRGFSVFDKNGKSKRKYRSGIKPKIFRTPTPWHKYQYRPAKKAFHLYLVRRTKERELEIRIKIPPLGIDEVMDQNKSELEMDYFLGRPTIVPASFIPPDLPLSKMLGKPSFFRR